MSTFISILFLLMFFLGVGLWIYARRMPEQKPPEAPREREWKRADTDTLDATVRELEEAIGEFFSRPYTFNGGTPPQARRTRRSQTKLSQRRTRAIEHLLQGGKVTVVGQLKKVTFAVLPGQDAQSVSEVLDDAEKEVGTVTNYTCIPIKKGDD